MNANVNPSSNGIAAQPSPSAAVNKFLALKPRLFNIQRARVRGLADLAAGGGNRTP